MVTGGVGDSRHRDGARAAGDAVEAALAHLRRDGAQGRAAGVLLFATNAHADPHPVVRGARAAAGDIPLVGCTASGILSGDGEAEEGTAVVALAIPEDVACFRPFSCSFADPPEVPPRKDGSLALLFADGYSRHPEILAREVAARLPGTPVIGGLAVGTAGVGPAYRWVDDEVTSHGAVGAVLGVRGKIAIGVAQGCLPIGVAHTVTSAEGNVIKALGDRPAFEVLTETVGVLADDLASLSQKVFVGVSVKDDLADDVADEYVIRGLLAFDPDRGFVAVSEPLPVGRRVRFALRDAQAGRRNLRAMLERVRRDLGGRAPRLGLYFNCAGRGRSLFGCEDHDLAYIRRELGEFPLAGIFSGGELGPGGESVRLHLFSGVLAVVA